jgi:uncharacterized membrane-anchored protein
MARKDSEPDTFESEGSRPEKARPRGTPDESSHWFGSTWRRETTQKTLLAFTLGVMAIALLAFLLGINSIIETWLRPQWVPIARTVVAAAVVAVCLYVLRVLTRRPSSA